MSLPGQNPFEITKAVDFTDEQITEYWVDIAGENFLKSLKPASSMPMIILGGKGSGKTHLMRYFSYASQKIRHANIIEGIQSDGYIGIYLRCGGLNANRFGELEGNKGDIAFSYYMDLWLAEICIKTVIDIFNQAREDIPSESQIANEICDLFNGNRLKTSNGLSLIETLELVLNKQKSIDLAVNNYPFTESFNIDIETSPGKLVFAIPKIFCKFIPKLSETIFSFFIDEFENLNLNHQKYVNTLVREKELPCSFKIGSRLYGIKTFETYSANEINKPGSEFDFLKLDLLLRTGSEINYKEFCRSLFSRRLKEAGFIHSTSAKGKEIDEFFEIYADDDFHKESLNFVHSKYASTERPAHLKLVNKLREAGYSESDILGMSNYLTVTENPLLEKTNFFLFYQDWYQKKDLKKSANEIAISSEIFQSLGEGKRHKHVLGHFKGDLHAQILRECGRKQQYLGVNTFIKMSSGLPRNFLMILKHIYQWSSYRNEAPFKWSTKISIESQRQGIMEAAEWFFQDARISGEDIEVVRASISALARLFRSLRYSDKPTESSISTFSIDTSKITAVSRHTITLASSLSLLIEIGKGQRNRNTGGTDSKYQINPMLAPRWDLPIARRGAIGLSSEEINSIFDPHYKTEFEELLKIRVDRMTAPKFGRSKIAASPQKGLGFDL